MKVHYIVDKFKMTLQQYMKRFGKVQQLLGICFVLMTTVTAIPLEEFYPFGEENGDALLDRTLDGSSPVIPFPLPLNFFGQIYYNISVSSQMEFSQYTPIYIGHHIISFPKCRIWDLKHIQLHSG